MFAGAEQEACSQAVEPGRVSGTKAWNAFVSPQVTGLRFGSTKIGQVFEFMPLSSARQDSNLRSRLRRPSLCVALTSGNVLAEILPGRV